jgi:NADPH:quinone reductase-like Zn-dependent oxidoreductase
MTSAAFWRAWLIWAVSVAATATADLPREALQEILDVVAAGQLSFPVDRVYDGLEQVRQAQDDMEHDRATGKLVVCVRH